MSISNDPFKIGEWTAEPELDRISCSNGSTALRPQVMKLLVFLASHMGKVISTEEMLKQLWPNKVVTEGTVYNTLAELRNVLATANDGHTYIETIPKKGYRLVDPVAKEVVGPISGDLPPSAAVPTSARKFDNKSILALVGGLFVVVALIIYVAWPLDDRSIAVLPFEDVSPEGDQAYFGNGIADELRLELQRLDGIRVAGRTSSIAYAQEDSKTIGEILNVDSILEGSIRKEGNSVRISVQLTHVADGFTIWSKSYNRELENILEMQEEIATSIAGALGVKLGVGAINAFRGAGTRNVEAYEAFLQAQDRNPNLNYQEKLRRLERATELDPNYAAAWAQLGVKTLSTNWGSNPEEQRENIERAYAFVLRAVELDPESAQSTSLLGVLLSARTDFISSEAAHVRALSLLSDRPNLRHYGNFLMRTGRSAAALEQYEKAEAVEPLGGQLVGYRVHIALAQGRFADAREVLMWYPKSRITNARLAIALNEGDSEDIKATIAAMPPAALSTTALYSPVLSVFDSPERVLSTLRATYADNGSRWPSKLHDIALLAAYFGDPELALQTIGEELRNSNIRLHAVWYSVMSEVRKLPGFKALVTDLNLVEYWRTSGWADLCRPLGDDDFECI